MCLQRTQELSKKSGMNVVCQPDFFFTFVKTVPKKSCFWCSRQTNRLNVMSVTH